MQVNDSSMALLGGDDYRHVVELVVNKMEVYCRKASLSTTTIRFVATAICCCLCLRRIRHECVVVVVVFLLQQQ